MHITATTIGMGGGLIRHGWEGLANSAKIFLGNFYLDENASFFGSVWQGVSRHTWESLQTGLGYDYTQIRNGLADIDRVDYLGGATFSTNESSRNGDQGITIGNNINIDISGSIDLDSFDDYVTSHPLYMHEYGHTIDGRLQGPAYLFDVGIPSIISAKNAKIIEYIYYTTTHNYREFEVRANRKAASYFGKYYGVSWSPFEHKYPLKYNLLK